VRWTSKTGPASADLTSSRRLGHSEFTSTPSAGCDLRIATSGGCFILSAVVRTIVFFDGQNLYHLARSAWSPGPQVPGSPYGYPSYDVEKIASALVARDPRRVLQQIRFYTGVPDVRGG
jgi:hypothetical protein